MKNEAWALSHLGFRGEGGLWSNLRCLGARLMKLPQMSWVGFMEAPRMSGGEFYEVTLNSPWARSKFSTNWGD